MIYEKYYIFKNNVIYMLNTFNYNHIYFIEFESQRSLSCAFTNTVGEADRKRYANDSKAQNHSCRASLGSYNITMFDFQKMMNNFLQTTMTDCFDIVQLKLLNRLKNTNSAF